ncbi:hypothetical protein Tco_1037085 [Tanacetum coccineum]
MVAYLEKSIENADFDEIFWSTAKIKIVNNERQIRAKVNGKTIVISESSVRRDLQFNDEDGIACLTNTEIFENLQLMGYENLSDRLTFYKSYFSHQWKYLIHTILQCLSSKSTAWNEFGTNIASAVICLAKNQKFNFSKLIFDGMLRNLDPNSKKFLMYPRFLQLFLNNQIENLTPTFNDEYDTPSHTKKVFANIRRQGKDFSGTVTPLFAIMLIQPQADVGEDVTVYEERGDNMERASTSTASLDAEQDNGNIIRTQSMAIHNEPIPQRTGSGSGPKRQDNILGEMHAQTRFERLSKQSNDPPLSGVNTPGSGEDRLKNMELMEICTKLSDRGRYDQDIYVTTASAPITTAGVSISTAEPTTEPVMFCKCIHFTAGVSVKRSYETATIPTVPPQQQLNPKDKGKGIMQEPEKPVKVKGKYQIEYDADVAQRLQAELDKEVRLEREREEKKKKKP